MNVLISVPILKSPTAHAFLIKADGELAGFVLINKVGSTPDVDWNIGEFFIVSKFQGKGVGRYAAKQVFNQFPGISVHDKKFI